VLGEGVVRGEEGCRRGGVEQRLDARLDVGRLHRDGRDEPAVVRDARVAERGAVALQPAGVRRPVGVDAEERDPAVPLADEVHRRFAAAALVVDQNRVAGNRGEAAVDLDDRGAVRAEEARRLRADRRHDHAGRAHRDERAHAGELLVRVAPVAEHHHLVVRLAQHLLDPGSKAGVELVVERGQDDADDAARAVLERLGRGVRHVAEPVGDGEQAVADGVRHVAAPAERPRRRRGRGARLAREVRERDRAERWSRVRQGRHPALPKTCLSAA
jgi:hypothetical protein